MGSMLDEEPLADSRDYPKAITIINHIDSLNLGDASLLYMTISLINKALHPREIFVLSFYPENDKNLINLMSSRNVKVLLSPGRTSQSDKMKIRAEMLKFLIRVLSMRLLHKTSSSLLSGSSASDALQMSELVVVRGGDNLADTYGAASLIAQIYNILLAMILRKKIIILGTSIGPFRSRILRRMTSYFLRKVDLITVRDLKSANMLREDGIDEEKIHFIRDIAFDLPVHLDKSYDDLFDDPRVSHIGIGISGLSSMYAEKDQIAKQLASLCDQLTARYKSKIIFIPHVLSQFNDKDFASYVLSKLSRQESVSIIHETNPMKIKYIISRLDLLISFRMHPLVHALSLGVPAIGIDYNDKTRELFRLFHKEDWVVSIQDLTRLPELADSFFAKKEKNNQDFSIRHPPEPVSTEYVRLLEKFVADHANEH